MVVSLTVPDPTAVPVLVGLSPLAEMLACLHVLAEPDHHPESRPWVASTRARLPDRVWSGLRRFAPLWARYRARFFYPLTLHTDLSLAEELAALAGLDDDVFVPLAANATRGLTFAAAGAPGDAERVLDGPDWVRDCEHRSFLRGDLAVGLVSDPRRFRNDLIDTLTECATAFFTDEWERARPVLQRGAADLRARLESAPLVDTLASLSDMASTRGFVDTVIFDKLQSDRRLVGPEGLVLFPSIRAWPHVTIKLDRGLPVTIPFLVQEQDRARSRRSQADVRRRMSVLAEPARWALCRHLIGESITTTELARRTGTTKYAVSRHLRVMREAGLISSQRAGRQIFHRMNAAAITYIGYDALRSIMR